MPSSSGGTWWEWYPEVTWQHDFNRIYCVPPNGSDYGAVVDQDLKPPQKIITLKGHGLQAADIVTLETAVQARGTTFTVTDYRGINYTGTIMSLTFSGLPALDLFDATIQLRI